MASLNDFKRYVNNGDCNRDMTKAIREAVAETHALGLPVDGDIIKLKRGGGESEEKALPLSTDTSAKTIKSA